MHSIVAYLLLGLLWLLLAGLLHDSEVLRLLRKEAEAGKMNPKYLWNDFCLNEYKNFRVPVRFTFTVLSMTGMYILAGIVYILSGLIFKTIIYKTDPKD